MQFYCFCVREIKKGEQVTAIEVVAVLGFVWIVVNSRRNGWLGLGKVLEKCKNRPQLFFSFNWGLKFVFDMYLRKYC